MIPETSSFYSRPYSRHEWRVAGVTCLAYIATSVLAARFVPFGAEIYPATAVALCGLYFGGPRLFPLIYIAALLSAALSGFAPAYLAAVPLAATATALAGAYLLRISHIDALFRRSNDVLYLFGTALTVSAISPALSSFAALALGVPYTLEQWGHAYITQMFCLVIITPFLLRWFTKPHFSRTSTELLEMTGIFAVLIGIDFFLYVRGVMTVWGVPLEYLLLIPFFYIAMRLRPRFVTLALFITALLSIVSGLRPGSVSDLDYFFDTEILMIVLSGAFLIITSLDEELRVNTNLMRSQLATLENAMVRVSTESRAKNDFIAILAHELRNPLAPIVSAIELMKLKEPRDPDDIESLDMMADRMATIRRLLDDLLDISRISEGKITLRQERIDLETVLKRAMLSTEHHRKQLHQKLAFRAHPSPLPIIGDSLRLEQIFSNLLTNASKYSDPGDTITVIVSERGGIAEVTIADEGIGLSESALESIFLPFQQLGQDERSAKGLGIGLALVKSFVEMHGGTVVARSEGVGKGSRFIVTLPIAQEADLNTARTAHVPARRMRLALIVDDNDADSGSTGRLLELEGWTVAYAYEGAQALERTMSLAPEAVLVDLDMSRENSMQLVERIRELGYRGRIIGLTSSSEKRKAAKDLLAYIIMKPIGFSELRTAMPERS